MTNGNEHALVEVGYRPLPVTAEREEAMSRYFAMSLRPNETAPALPKMRQFAAIAISLGLHPLAGEIMVYEGSLYVTIDGRRRLAMRHPDFAAIQPSIVTDSAIREAMQANRHGDVLAVCHLYRKSTPIPTIQYGLVRESERYPSTRETEKLGLTKAQVDAARAAHNPAQIMDLASNPEAKVRPLITQPAIMAMKRAEGRCLNLIAQVALPTFDNELDTPMGDEPNGRAGEVVDGEVVEEPSAPPAADAASLSPANGPDPSPAHDGLPERAEEPQASPAAGRPPARASHATPPRGETREGAGGGLVNPPETIDQLQRFAVERLHFRNAMEICNALGVQALTDVKDVPAAWRDLCRLKGE